MKQLIFILAGLAISEVAICQNNNLYTSPNIQENLNSIMKGSAGMTMDNRYEGLSGTPYVVPRWLSATITTRQNKVIEATPLKYDVLQQHLLMRDPHNGDSLLLDDNAVASFVLHDPDRLPEKRAFRRFLEAPVPAQSREFVEVLHQGKYTLLKQYSKEVQKASYKGAYSTDRRADEIRDKITYYLLGANKSATPVKLNVKALQTVAPDLAAALKEEASKRPARTESDLVALLQAVDK
ncbi:hypothetical protein [Hymenobacter crusticola]|uniref:Uncharacterized protein n=1 Tax=Hymenobacter crusticola TaxID=1770526 RepID=A0A243WAQ2_9BACT|nr:hypothetical protein [Hymenobacter crusticola]OUJ72644.1 hypothetical protein BXP70_17160 [Hymenobacter crusticola]